MATSLKDVRKRYPFVKEFATWNEANINKRPETVARWWLAMRKACPTLHDPRRRPAGPQQRRHLGPALRQGGQAHPEGLGPAQLHRRQHAEDDRHAQAAGRRQGRGLVHRDRRRRLAQQRLGHRVPDRRGPRRQGHQVRLLDAGASSARASSASTCTTGTRASAHGGRTRRGTRASSAPTTSRARRWRCCRRCWASAHREGRLAALAKLRRPRYGLRDFSYR